MNLTLSKFTIPTDKEKEAEIDGFTKYHRMMTSRAGIEKDNIHCTSLRALMFLGLSREG